MQNQKVTAVYAHKDGQVNIEVTNQITGRAQWFNWSKYPGQLPVVGETF